MKQLLNKTVKCNFRSEKTIKFYDVNDFNQILLTYSVVPHKPGALYAVTPSTLLYVDISTSPNEIHWLDLSESQPKLATGKRVIHTQQDPIYDMCCYQDGGEHLLALVDGNVLFAYNTSTDKLEWKVDRKPPGMEKRMDLHGVTTNNRGLLFVCDWIGGGECIHLFRASDGKYLGCLMKDEKKLGVPARICWCEKTSSLITVCWCNSEFYINAISVQF